MSLIPVISVLLASVPCSWSTEASQSSSSSSSSEAAAEFFQNLTLSQPNGLKVTASDSGYLHVAVILQV